MKQFLDWLATEENGQGMVEYALLIALISMAAVLAITQMSGSIQESFGKAEEALSTID